MKESKKSFAVLLSLIIFGAACFADVSAQNLRSVLPSLEKFKLPFARQALPNQIYIPDLQRDFNNLIGKAQEKGTVRVIIGFQLENYRPDAEIGKSEQTKQQSDIKQKQASLLRRLNNFNVEGVRQFDYIPFIAMEVSADALSSLRNSDEISSIHEDELQAPMLLQSIPLIGAPNAWAAGFNAQGRTIAVLDSGVDKTHPFFNNRVVSEACYSTNTATNTSYCPGGVSSSTAPGSGMNCNVSQVAGCTHGTHVAGIAAGGHPQINGSGVARNANIIAMQVFARSTDCAGETSPCNRGLTSDTIAGLERVYALRTTYTIDAVNLSLGGGQYTSYCDAQQTGYKAIFDTLRAAGIAPVVASGNSGYPNALASPACVSSAVSIGSTHDGSAGLPDFVSDFSNSASFLNLLAPGELITSAVPGGSYDDSQGTSQAAPHVAGVWAVIKQKFPNDSVKQVLTRLKYSGVQVYDAANGIYKPRIKVDTALNTSNVDPCDSSITLSFGQTVNGSIAQGDCIMAIGARADNYTFTANQGQTISISQSSSQFNSFLILYNSAGAEVAFDNDGGGGQNARIPAGSGMFTIPATGTYTIKAASLLQGVGNYTLTLSAGPLVGNTRRPYDFDGDGKTDLSIFRPSVGEWWYLRSIDGGNYAAQFGNASDKIVPADFTGDGKADIAIWRPSTGEWFILRSENGSYYSFPFGAGGDIPAPADYDADGKTDAAVFRPSNSTWYINKSTGGTIIQQFGANGDFPVASDYDGDGRADIAIWRASAGQWWVQRSTAGTIAFTFGNSLDKPVPGDYTGDGKTDVAIWRPSSGEWFILRSENFSYYSFPFGTVGDVPAPGDYDGDGRFDAAVFRQSGSTWYVQRSTSGTLIQSFGTNGDRPVPNAFVP